MRTIFSAVMLFFCVSLSAQEITPLIYSEVVVVDHTSADELFTRGRTWFATAYNDSKVVLQMAEDHRLVGKAAEVLDIYGGFALGNFTVRVSYDISVECREGRYKYVIDNIVAHSRCGWADFGLLTTADVYKEKGSGAKTLNKIWQDVKEKFGTYQMILSTSLKGAMAKTNQPPIDENW